MLTVGIWAIVIILLIVHGDKVGPVIGGTIGCAIICAIGLILLGCLVFGSYCFFST